MGIFIGLTFIGLAMGLAHIADRQADAVWRYLGSFVLAALWLIIALCGMMLAVVPLVDLPDNIAAGANLGGDPGSNQALFESLLSSFPKIGAWTFWVAIVAILLLLPWPRRLLARLIPIDPERLVHTIALHGALVLVLFSAFTAFLVQSMLSVLEAGDDGGLQTLIEDGTTVGGLWAQQLGFVALAFLGVGLFFARTPVEAMRRLGWTRAFSWRWYLGAVASGVGMALLVQVVWNRLLPDSQAGIEQLSEMMFGPIVKTGLVGALTIGLAAGLGEETLFRGAMQPRFGIVFTSMLFAVIHTQYGVSLALVQILAIALIFGLVRQRANTLTAMAAHATYNLIFALAAVIGSQTPLWHGGPVVPIPEDWKATPTAVVSPVDGIPPAMTPTAAP
ncbi:MAG: CPBP family intramembrane metalloprotease [Ardenticatenia bacterium]|nr:CPBP family intramembrane metalloprotease [Ardenticatenia bacterium]